MLYNFNNITLATFIECFDNKKLTELVFDGIYRRETLEQAFNDILIEYFESTNESIQYKHYFVVLKECLY